LLLYVGKKKKREKVKQKKIQSSGENLFNGWLDKFLISVWINNEKKYKPKRKMKIKCFMM
jgi:hypothetical protein